MVDLLRLQIQAGKVIAAGLDQIEAAIQACQVGLASRVHVIQNHDLFSIFQEDLHQIGADESRAAGNQYAHDLIEEEELQAGIIILPLPAKLLCKSPEQLSFYPRPSILPRRNDDLACLTG